MSESKSVFDTEPHKFVEKVMEELGVRWSIKTVDVAAVDIKDNTYQTRRNVSESAASVSREYADKIKTGEAFPMVVLQEKSPGRFRVVCGRHRATAYAIAQNGKCAYAAYVVDGSSSHDDLTTLSARENNANGVREGNADTARFAAGELFKLPAPAGSRCHRPRVVKDVASRFGANFTTVRDNYFARLVEREMLRVGVQYGGVPVTALRALWGWTDSAEWRTLAAVVSENASLPGLSRIVSEARRDKLDAKTLIEGIRESASFCSGAIRQIRPQKDPATVTLEHLSLALNDLRDLAPPRNLPEEQADDISSMVEAVRVACKEWKSR